MGAKSEQLLVLKEEEKLLLTFRSRINDQLNRLKVEELSILSMMRKAQEESFSREEVNLDEIDNDTEEVANGGTAQTRDISHLTTMTGGFRADTGVVGDGGGVFRATDGDDRTTTMEVDLGDFESGNGGGFGAFDFMAGGMGEGGMAGAPRVTPVEMETARREAGEEVVLVPLDLGGFQARTKIENDEEEEEDD